MRNFLRASVLPMLAAGALALPAGDTFAYRPFDSTDASVADGGEFELEFSPLGYLREGDEKFLVAPAAVLILGIGHDRELVLEVALFNPIDHSASGSGSILDDTMLSLKQVHRHGSLQDGSGVSIASECGVLLPGSHGVNGTGAVCYGIVSQRWEAATVHLNGGLGYTRDHHWERSLGVIVEGPDKWTVRPVLELKTSATMSASIPARRWSVRFGARARTSRSILAHARAASMANRYSKSAQV